MNPNRYSFRYTGDDGDELYQLFFLFVRDEDEEEPMLLCWIEYDFGVDHPSEDSFVRDAFPGELILLPSHWYHVPFLAT